MDWSVEGCGDGGEICFLNENYLWINPDSPVLSQQHYFLNIAR